jgi:RNA polymerase sigma-70 factor, ECF subfamily
MATLPIALPPFAPLPTLWPALPDRPSPRPPQRPVLPTPTSAAAIDQPRVTLEKSRTESVVSFVQDPTSGEPDRAQPLPARPALAADPARAAEQEQLRELALACIAGDAGAWQQLVRSQHRRIYGICYRFTGSQTDAEDLTQDVFIKLYRSLSSFDPAKGAFQTWIVTLTRNLLVDHFRRTRQDRATDSLDVSLGDEGDGPTRADQLADNRTSQFDTVARQQMRARIQCALKQISPELREAVILRDLEDLDYKEIAQVLRVPEGTVKSRISRGRAELARILQREGITRSAATGGAAR